MRSLSRVLTVRFSLTMLLGLLLIGLSVASGMRRVLNRELDRSLRAALALESAVLAADFPIPFQQPWVDEDEFISRVNRFVTLRDSTGRVMHGNTPAAASIPLDSAAFEAARAGELGWARHEWRGRNIRSVYSAVPSGVRADWAVVQIAASLDDVEHTQATVFWIVLLTALVITAATGLGAGWLAQSTTAPVGEIIRQTEAISAGNLNDRITAHANVLEYRDLVRVLNDMLHRLNGAIQAQRRIIADTGHDIRTPITAMQGELEVMLRSERSPEEYKRVLRSCLEEVTHLATISDSLLLLARLESRDVQPRVRPTDVAGVVTGAMQKAEQRRGSHTIRLIDGSGGREVSLDRHMLEIALDHLIANALQHTPDDAQIVIRIGTAAAALEITVEDDGPGIPAEMHARLFERLFRGDAARSRSGGAGLGLTITDEILRAHGGTANADASPLGGLRVTLRFPLVSTPAPAGVLSSVS